MQTDFASDRYRGVGSESCRFVVYENDEGFLAWRHEIFCTFPIIMISGERVIIKCMNKTSMMVVLGENRSRREEDKTRNAYRHQTR